MCHSKDKEKVLKEESKMSFLEKQASVLTEKGMMVPKFAYYPEFKKSLIGIGYKIVQETDVSKAIIPSLKRFEKLAGKFFSFPTWIGQIILRIFPKEFTANSISGYLMPVLIEHKLSSYMITIAEKVD